MKSIFSRVVQFRGSHYDFGFWQGEQIRDSTIIANRKRQWRLYKPKFSVPVKEARKVYNTYAPGLWEELIGLRDSLEIPMEQVLRDFGGYRVPLYKSACSTVVTSDYLVRNYDYHPHTYEGRYVLFKPSDDSYATIGPSQRIVGRMDGMNEHGLSIAYNFTHRKKPGKGFICHAISRILLEQAKNVDEAVQLLKDLPHRHSFSYIVVDARNEHRTIEATPRQVTVRKAPLCTNHFHVLTAENRWVIDESLERMKALERKWKNLSVQETFSLLNDPEKGVFVEDYHNWAGTIHTSAYLPKQLQAWIALGHTNDPQKISFQKWIQGNDLSIKKISGKVRTNLTFAHMGYIRR